MFLLKTVLLLAFVIAVIPAGEEASTVKQGGISTVEVLSAARDVWHDAATFCERNQQTCETGDRLAAAFGAKARNGAKMLYVFLDGRFGRTGSDDTASGSVTSKSG